jgi:adenylate cyclase class 2
MIGMKDVEIEIQVRISDTELLLKFLSANAEFKGEKFQKDQYFSPANRNFLDAKPIKEWLRLRESNTNSLNYKNWHYDTNGKSNYCDEFETVIDNIDQVRKIFNAIDIKPIVTVEKNRKIWNFKDYEISVDSVVNLGDFVEIEYKGQVDNVNPKNITDEMIKFLKDIGIKKIERNYVGYPFLLLFPDGDNFEIV